MKTYKEILKTLNELTVIELLKTKSDVCHRFGYDITELTRELLICIITDRVATVADIFLYIDNLPDHENYLWIKDSYIIEKNNKDIKYDN